MHAHEFEKLRILAPHWRAHSTGHSAEFRQWLECATKAERPDVAHLLQEVVGRAAALDHALEALCALLGSMSAPHPHHHHPHDHSHG